MDKDKMIKLNHFPDFKAMKEYEEKNKKLDPIYSKILFSTLCTLLDKVANAKLTKKLK